MDGFKRPPRRPDGLPHGVGNGHPASPNSETVHRQFPQYQAGQLHQHPQPQPQIQPQPQPITSPQEYRQSHIPAQPEVSQLIAPDINPELDPKPAPTQRRKPKWPLVVGGLLILLLASAVGAFLWYKSSLEAVDPSRESDGQSIVVEKGSTWSDVAARLAESGVIRSGFTLEIYARVNGSLLKQGTCIITPAQTVPQIVKKLGEGCHDFKSIMFYPGATIEEPLYKPDYATGLDQSAMYIKGVLKMSGYGDDEIAAALARTYDSPLFADKPADATLEGYIYGQTYYVDTKASVEDILKETFDQMYADIEKHDMIPKFEAQELNLFQAVTMASIVQRELNCEGKPTEERKERCYQYQRTIAQVFIKRLKEGIPLGSDVTFIYAADMMGVPPQIDLDSPYNTRKYAGLPPGPVGSPGLLALRSVAEPTDTDYLYFVAGDDGLIYFARTLAEHEANTRQHCKVICQL